MELREKVDGIRLQLDALQRFPTSDPPRVFAEIGRTAGECRVETGLETKNIDFRRIILEEGVQDMEDRRAALIALN